MTPTLAQLFAVAFALSAVGLLALVAAITRKQFGAQGAQVPFLENENDWMEDPVVSPSLQRVRGSTPAAPDPEALRAREEADLSTRSPVLAFIISATFWLVLGSVFGLIVSLKFHFPDWLSGSELFTLW